MTSASTAPTQHAPLIGFGHVYHTRLRPRAHRFAYATFQLLLPMRTLQHNPATAGVLAVNRKGWLSFWDADHGDGRPPKPVALWHGYKKCCLHKTLPTPMAKFGCNAIHACAVTASSR